MNNTEYSPYKFVHHQDRIADIKENKSPQPLQAQLILTNRCNHSCTFCAYRMKDSNSNQLFNDRDELDKNMVIKKLLPSLKRAGIKAIQFTGGGEPLVHKGFVEVVSAAQELGFKCALVTNGVLMNDRICKLIKDFSWIRISIDAGKSETYASIRGCNNFALVIRNIMSLKSMNPTATIGIGFVMNKENYREVVTAAGIARDLEVDNFRISGVFTPQGYDYFAGWRERAIELAKIAEDKTTTEFKVFNLFNDRLVDNFVGVQDYDKCYIKDLDPYIGADGWVYTCCTLAYNEKGRVFDLHDYDFDYEEGHKNDPRSAWINTHHNPKKHCQFPCMYRNKNKFISYCVCNNPKHVEFI